jgi:hypothetical protein
MQEHFRRHSMFSQEDMVAEQISVSPDIRGKTEILWNMFMIHKMKWIREPLYAVVSATSYVICFH